MNVNENTSLNAVGDSYDASGAAMEDALRQLLDRA